MIVDLNAKMECFNMTNENIVRAVAGSMVLLSLALAHFFSPWWLLLTAFVGLNLLQSAFTKFCPLTIILEKMGRPSCNVKPGG